MAKRYRRNRTQYKAPTGQRPAAGRKVYTPPSEAVAGAPRTRVYTEDTVRNSVALASRFQAALIAARGPGSFDPELDIASLIGDVEGALKEIGQVARKKGAI